MQNFEIPEIDYMPVEVGPAYTNAHWAIEKAIEIDSDVRTIIPNAEVILEFLKEHAYSSAEETEVLYNMNSEPVTTETHKRGSWR